MAQQKTPKPSFSYPSPTAYTGMGIGIAFLDTGISPVADFTVPTERIVAFRDFINGHPQPYDDNGHGTHVTGAYHCLAVFLQDFFCRNYTYLVHNKTVIKLLHLFICHKLFHFVFFSSFFVGILRLCKDLARILLRCRNTDLSALTFRPSI